MNASDECAENIKILERGFVAFADECKEQSDIWRTLDTKAQGMIGASGLFLAATYAFSREPSILPITKAILVITLISLVWAILAALGVLRAAEFEIPDAAEAIASALAAVKTPMANCGDRYRVYLEEQLEGAADILAGLSRVNDTKRRKRETSQRFLAVAASWPWPGRS